jgi:hypothetical protein
MSRARRVGGDPDQPRPNTPDSLLIVVGRLLTSIPQLSGESLALAQKGRGPDKGVRASDKHLNSTPPCRSANASMNARA